MNDKCKDTTHKYYVCKCGKEFDTGISLQHHEIHCLKYKEWKKEQEQILESKRLPNGLFKCENPGCPNEHDGSYGSGRFCSEHCGRSFCGKKSPGAPKGHKRNPGKPGGWKCLYCGLIFHTRRDKQEHVRINHPEFYGSTSWNRGLTKETNEYVRKNGESVSNAMKKLFEEGELNNSSRWTEELKKEQSERKKKLFKEHPELHPNRRVAKNRNTMTYPEKIAYDWLVRNNIKFEHQYNFRTEKFNRFVDFYCEDYKLFIEIDGEYWHKDKGKDIQKDEDAKNNGYTTVRISAKERIEKKLNEVFTSLSN